MLHRCCTGECTDSNLSCFPILQIFNQKSIRCFLFQKRCAHLLCDHQQKKILGDSCCYTLNRSHALNDDTNASRRQFPSEKTTISLSLLLLCTSTGFPVVLLFSHFQVSKRGGGVARYSSLTRQFYYRSSTCQVDFSCALTLTHTRCTTAYTAVRSTVSYQRDTQNT